MGASAAAVRVQYTNVAFLTCAAGVHFGATLTTGTVTAAAVRGYIASIKGYVWGKTDPVSNGLRARLAAVEADMQLQHWLNQNSTAITAWNPIALGSPALPLHQLRQLDHIALDLKEAAGHPYLCRPILNNVARTLGRPTNALRNELSEVIDLFQENSQTAGAAPIQTVAGPLRGSQRIDRENLTGGTHWTYRLQADTLVVGGTYGGILMQINVAFHLPSLQAAFTASLQSVPLRQAGQPATAQGFYVRCDAPAWLTAILAA